MNDVVLCLKSIESLLLEYIREQQLEPSVLIGKSELADMLGESTATVDRLRSTGKLGPNPLRLTGPNSPLKWHRNEVLAWLAHRGPDGELYDAQLWPQIWAKINKKLS